MPIKELIQILGGETDGNVQCGSQHLNFGRRSKLVRKFEKAVCIYVTDKLACSLPILAFEVPVENVGVLYVVVGVDVFTARCYA